MAAIFSSIYRALPDAKPPAIANRLPFDPGPSHTRLPPTSASACLPMRNNRLQLAQANTHDDYHLPSIVKKRRLTLIVNG